jgi:hypothetical protein
MLYQIEPSLSTPEVAAGPREGKGSGGRFAFGRSWKKMHWCVQMTLMRAWTDEMHHEERWTRVCGGEARKNFSTVVY